MSTAALFPFVNLYLRETGFSGTYIGIITSAGLVTATIGYPIWGLISDLLETRKGILHLNLLLALVLGIVLSFVKKDFLTLFIILALLNFLMRPLRSIADTMVLIDRKDDIVYGRVLLWGSLGYALAAILTGRILQEVSLQSLFYVFAVITALPLLTSFCLPARKKKTKIHRELRRRKSFSFMRSHAFLLFVIFSFLVGFSASMHLTFFGIYLTQIGAKEGVVGLAVGIGALSEIVMLFYVHRLLRRFGCAPVLFVSAILAGIRWISYAFLSSPTLVLIVQVTQGMSVSLFLVSGIVFISQIVPNQVQATGQGIFAATFMLGPSGALGSFLGGIIFDAWGVSAMYGIAGIISITAALLFRWRMKPTLG